MPLVLLNQRSGSLDAAADRAAEDSVRAALAAAGTDAEIRSVPGDRMRDEVLAAVKRGVDLVIAGGGDGTLSTVAGALSGSNTPMAILPLGTLNHFAKDLGIPLDLAEAAQVIAGGHMTPVDVAVVNDRVFINNASLGVYARALIDRDAKRRHLGWRKWPAMMAAALKIFRRSPMVRVRLATPGESRIRKTPLVFIGNNRYPLDIVPVGKRDRIDRGELCVYVATTSTRWGMLRILLRGVVGRLEQSRDFETLLVDHVSIDSRRRQLPVAIDGEIERLRPPLEFKIWPAALRVITPRPVYLTNP